ncbi:polysaccharide biosynthesis/export family protein [Filimonas effusa]|uniref:Uncharacterized protein n=1 Tax=Filimonas effusa TaxID=2508721 RepID=A0A4Q1DD06_9BACT|nr:polysaccharide biosynthesis/export family protein [Filimonas effusa]RXK87362.1 hypothetical protein ESB13_11455 [Filimonas effusa]
MFRTLVAGLLLPLVLFVFVTSCNVNKNVTYFRDIPDTLSSPFLTKNAALFHDPVIKSNDLLQVSIQTLESNENGLYGGSSLPTTPLLPNLSTISGNNAQAAQSYLVDKLGMIELPVIGKIKVGGMTSSAARDTIYSVAVKFYNTPIVSVRLANFSITVLGEVSRPGTYIVPNEKVSILDVLGMAGDLTIYGKRENVLLMKDSAGIKKAIRFDLTSTKTLQSPYFYLEQGDMVYVEPNKSRIASTDAVKTRNYTLIASILTVLIVLVTRI